MLDRRQKLIDLGADTLADGFLNFSAHSEVIDDLIEQLIATPKENVRRFKKKLSDLKRQHQYIEWHESSCFSRELEMLLQELKSSVDDSLTGLELITAFYETDNSILNRCDDSTGEISGVYRHSAQELFLDYAKRCSDKEKVANIILELNQNDNFGSREGLMDCAAQCLPEDIIHTMIAKLQRRADQSNVEYYKRCHHGLIESLARQIKDAALFEQTRVESQGKLSTAAYIDIAQVYFECGDVESAHSWLKKIPEEKAFKTYEKDLLLEKIYRKQDDCEKLAELLFQKFKSFHSTDTLQALLDVVGHDRKDEIINAEVAQILNSDIFCEFDAKFLISIGKIDEAERYLLECADQFDGNYYSALLSLAEAMEAENRHLASSLMFRSLLISILERGYTKAYPHGIRYLKKLDKLSASIDNWKAFNHHNAFKEQIFRAHGRKRSFWSNYEGQLS